MTYKINMITHEKYCIDKKQFKYIRSMKILIQIISKKWKFVVIRNFSVELILFRPGYSNFECKIIDQQKVNITYLKLVLNGIHRLYIRCLSVS